MSASHHSEQTEMMKRFAEELEKRAKRRYPDGRAGGDDDGVTAFAIAVDDRHKIIRLEFTKPMDWLGFDLQTAEKFLELFQSKVAELKSL